MRIKGKKGKTDIEGANVSLGLCNHSNLSLCTSTSAKHMIRNLNFIAKGSIETAKPPISAMKNY